MNMSNTNSNINNNASGTNVPPHAMDTARTSNAGRADDRNQPNGGTTSNSASEHYITPSVGVSSHDSPAPARESDALQRGPRPPGFSHEPAGSSSLSSERSETNTPNVAGESGGARCASGSAVASCNGHDPVEDDSSVSRSSSSSCPGPSRPAVEPTPQPEGEAPCSMGGGVHHSHCLGGAGSGGDARGVTGMTDCRDTATSAGQRGAPAAAAVPASADTAEPQSLETTEEARHATPRAPATAAAAAAATPTPFPASSSQASPAAAAAAGPTEDDRPCARRILGQQRTPTNTAAASPQAAAATNANGKRPASEIGAAAKDARAGGAGGMSVGGSVVVVQDRGLPRLCDGDSLRHALGFLSAQELAWFSMTSTAAREFALSHASSEMCRR